MLQSVIASLAPMLFKAVSSHHILNTSVLFIYFQSVKLLANNCSEIYLI